MSERFVIVNPFPAGFSNVLMSYEIAMAIAFITNRKLIVPPTSWCVLIDEKTTPKEQWQNIWDVCDITKAQLHFSTTNIFEHEELVPHIKKHTDDYSWLSLPSMFHKETTGIYDSELCLYNSSTTSNQQDFEDFINTRQVEDVNSENKFLLVQGFGHFWYNVYAPNKSLRNSMKQKIYESLKYKSKYYEISQEFIDKRLGSYNAIHVRNPWQLNYDTYTDVVNFKDNPKKLVEQLRNILENDKPIYISTDIQHKQFFNEVKKEYDIVFLDDLQQNLTTLEKIAVDQIISSKADKFYGSYYSTFSKRINILRGMNGKQADDYMGINKLLPEPSWNNHPIPWKIENRHWNWYDSSHVHWTME